MNSLEPMGRECIKIITFEAYMIMFRLEWAFGVAIQMAIAKI